MEGNNSELQELLLQTLEAQRFFEKVESQVLYRQKISRNQREKLSGTRIAAWFISSVDGKAYVDERGD